VRAHELKTDPRPFAAVWSGSKRYELRRNDRGYDYGDLLLLREHNREVDGVGYTGRVVLAEVTAMTRGGDYGLPDDLCVLGIRVLLVREIGTDWRRP
jgi:hypothetical protein